MAKVAYNVPCPARRGDVAVYVRRQMTVWITKAPQVTEAYYVGLVTGITRDGRVRQVDMCGLTATERHWQQVWVQPAAMLDMPALRAALAQRSFTDCFESLEAARAFVGWFRQAPI